VITEPFKLRMQQLGVKDLPYQELGTVQDAMSALALAGWPRHHLRAMGKAELEKDPLVRARKPHEGFSLVFAQT